MNFTSVNNSLARRTVRNKVLAGISFLLIITLGGCMWMPAPRDDLSVLGNDPFSNLIREAFHRKPDYSVGRAIGVNMLDQHKATQLSRELWLGKPSGEIIELFSQEGGACLPKSADINKKKMRCEVSRQWKFKNIGAPFDTTYWSDPAAKLVFNMLLSDADVVIDLNLDIFDVTVHKPRPISKSPTTNN